MKFDVKHTQASDLCIDLTNYELVPSHLHLFWESSNDSFLPIHEKVRLSPCGGGTKDLRKLGNLQGT